MPYHFEVQEEHLVSHLTEKIWLVTPFGSYGQGQVILFKKKGLKWFLLNTNILDYEKTTGLGQNGPEIWLVNYFSVTTVNEFNENKQFKQWTLKKKDEVCKISPILRTFDELLATFGRTNRLSINAKMQVKESRQISMFLPNFDNVCKKIGF